MGSELKEKQPDSKTWQRRLSRRSFIKGVALGGAGLAAAAVVGCGSEAARGPSPASKQTPEPDSLSPKPSEIQTAPPPTPEATKEPVKFIFGEDVPENLRDEIRNGVTIGVSWLAKKSGVNLGGLSVFAYGDADKVIDAYFKRTLVQGNFDQRRVALRQSTAFAGEQRDFFVITTSPGWTRASPIIGIGGPGPIKEGRYHTVVHEIFHVLQREVDGYRGDFPHWLNEGGAHYIAARVLAENNLYDWAKIREGHVFLAPRIRETLSSMESAAGFYNKPTADNYSLGFLATEFLTRNLPDDGIPALINFWQELGKGSNWRRAFANSFGRSPDQFYGEFEAYRVRGFQ